MTATAIYNGKAIDVDAGETLTAFEMACLRVRDNAGTGYVIDEHHACYGISPSSKRAVRIKDIYEIDRLLKFASR